MSPTAFEQTLAARSALVRGIEPEVAQLRRLRPLRRIAEVAVFLAIWGAGIAVGLLGPWYAVAAGMFLCAVAINALYLLSHEGHHDLLARRPWLNRALNLLLCAPLLHAPTAYLVLHERHHRHLGGPGDPDEYTNYTRRSGLLWLMHWMRLTLGTALYMALIPAVALRRATPRQRAVILAEYALLACAWVPLFVLLPIGPLLQFWLLPGILVGYFSAIRALAQHALTERGDPLLSSRTVRCGPVVSFLLLHENLHLEHHLFPEVPSYHLPRLHRLLAPRLDARVEGPSYTRFFLGFVARSLRRDGSVLGLTRAMSDRRPA